MVKSRIHNGSDFFETDHQVVAVVMETAQLILSQFKNFQSSQFATKNN